MEETELDNEYEIKRWEYENKEIRRKAILKVLNTKIDNYIPSIVFITDFQVRKFYDICVDKVKHKSYSFTINYNKPYELHHFVFFLTKKQIKENQKARRKRTKYTITFSGEHFKKTCLKSLELTDKIDYILRYKLLSVGQKSILYDDLFVLYNELSNDNDKKYLKEINKKINKINQKLNQKPILVPNNLSKLNIPPEKLKKDFTYINYTNYDDIDNTPKKNTTKKIQIKHQKINLPPINLPPIKRKGNKKIHQEILDSYKNRDYLKEDSSDDMSSKTFYKIAKKYKLQNQLKHLKEENAKKAKQLKSLKSKQDKINLHTFVKNTLKKYKEPKPKKKSIWDVVKLPKPLVI